MDMDEKTIIAQDGFITELYINGEPQNIRAPITVTAGDEISVVHTGIKYEIEVTKPATKLPWYRRIFR